jgi:hypothetical protein
MLGLHTAAYLEGQLLQTRAECNVIRAVQKIYYAELGKKNPSLPLLNERTNKTTPTHPTDRQGAQANWTVVRFSQLQQQHQQLLDIY